VDVFFWPIIQLIKASDPSIILPFLARRIQCSQTQVIIVEFVWQRVEAIRGRSIERDGVDRIKLIKFALVRSGSLVISMPEARAHPVQKVNTKVSNKGQDDDASKFHFNKMRQDLGSRT